MTNNQDGLVLEILLAVQDGKRDALSKLGDTNFDKAIEQSVASGLIQGLQANRMASGRLTLEEANHFGLTEKGLQFITDRNHRDHR